jgi:transglutaminase-like putative cysteine protease
MTQQAADQLLGLPVLDSGSCPSDLECAERVTFVLRQRFHYAYDGPVRDLDHRLVVIPRPRHGNDRRRVHALTVSSPVAPLAHRTTVRRDRAGNTTARIMVNDVPEAITFDLAAVVERRGPLTDARLPLSAVADPRLLRPTPLTTPDAPIRELALSLATRDPLETAARFTEYLHAAIAYDFGATSVSTTAAEALAGGRGVCQDHAHVMLAMCHVVGLPARYVSGHLLGEGGTHAWVEVVVPDGAGSARAVAFDPCNGRRAGAGYLTVAVGRDYADVAPTSGSYAGTASGRLTATKKVGVTAIRS